MKLLILLLLSSCSLSSLKPKLPNEPSHCLKKRKELSRASKLHICMKDFSTQGFDSEALVRICSKIHERSK